MKVWDLASYLTSAHPSFSLHSFESCVVLVSWKLNIGKYNMPRADPGMHTPLSDAGSFLSVLSPLWQSWGEDPHRVLSLLDFHSAWSVLNVYIEKHGVWLFFGRYWPPLYCSIYTCHLFTQKMRDGFFSLAPWEQSSQASGILQRGWHVVPWMSALWRDVSLS